MHISRYRDSEIKEHLTEDGRTVRYLARRFLPQSRANTALARTPDHERLDNVAARLLGDPTLYWQLCDASFVLSPSELEHSSKRGDR